MTRRELETLADLIVDKLENRKKDGLVGVAEASEITGLSVRTLYKMKDEIGYAKRGKSLMFSRRNLEVFNELRVKA